MVLTGPRDSPLRQTSPEMDLGSPSIWADLTGWNKTVLRRTVHTCFVKIIKKDYLKCMLLSVQEKNCIKSFFLFFVFVSLSYLMELVEESRMRPAEWGLWSFLLVFLLS